MDFVGTARFYLGFFLQDIARVLGWDDQTWANVYLFIDDQLSSSLPDWLRQIMAVPILFAESVWLLLKDVANLIPGDIQSVFEFLRQHILVAFAGAVTAWDWVIDRAWDTWNLVQDGWQLITDLATAAINTWSTTIADAIYAAQWIWDNGWALIVNLIQSTTATIWLYIESLVTDAINAAVNALGIGWLIELNAQEILTEIVTNTVFFIGRQAYLFFDSWPPFGPHAMNALSTYLLSGRDVLFALIEDAPAYIFAIVKDRVYDLAHDWLSENF